MDPMTISIDDRNADYVRAKVASGLYSDASEVVRDALTRMEDEDMHGLDFKDLDAEDIDANLSEGELALLRAQVAEAEAQIERGEYTEYEGDEGLRQLAEEIKAEGRAELLRAKVG